MNSIKASQVPLFTSREFPKDTQVISHKLLAKAGYIKKQASGFYIYLPFGWIVHRKIEEIVRDTMNTYGGIEVQLPILTPKELWQASGRWELMGEEMMRVQDRHKNSFALAPTHEESISWLAAQFLKSYKQLPINFYQISKKYRDEIRPRYGLIRCREFVMKDAYSFHLDEASLDETYQKMRSCYHKIFENCKLKTISVYADSGAMGGSLSEEFMVPCKVGEETLLFCIDEKNCGYKSNQEQTEFIPKEAYTIEKSQDLPERKETPGKKTVLEVAKFLNKDIENFIKAVVYENNDNVVIVFIPGDREISEIKLRNKVNLTDLAFASEETIKKISNSKPGFLGPYKMPLNVSNKKIHILYDRNLRGRGNLIGGGNKTDIHFINLQEGRDFVIPEDKSNLDLIQTQKKDICPKCRSNYVDEIKGIEVGHIFKLEKKYSKSLEASVLDHDGKLINLTMGCYGVGIGRILATVVEQHHDEYGIIWPESIAPFKYCLIGLFKNKEEKERIDSLFESFQESNLSVYYDDRSERAGVKFHDADLLGFPYQIIAGKNFIQNQKLEIKNRKTGKKEEVSVKELVKTLI